MDTETEAKIETRQEANRYFTVKVIINVIFLVLGALFVYFFIDQMQKEVALTKQAQDNVVLLGDVVELLDNNTQMAEELTTIYHEGNQETLDALLRVLGGGLSGELDEADVPTQVALIADLIERSGVEYVFLIDDATTMLWAPDVDLLGKNLVEAGMLSAENAAQLVAGTRDAGGNSVPVRETNALGDFYFYSLPIPHDGTTYILVVGADCSALNVQLGSLKDVGSVLGGMKLAGGFLFAVDPATDTFLYYENNGVVLTGQDALAHGLTAAAMIDGYQGFQTIDGVEYFCSSQMTGGRIVVSAVVAADVVLNANNTVKAWSVGAYLLVMVLCLAYAIFVRNSFVLNKTQTKTKHLFSVGKTDILLDRTLASKVAPLMICGVLAVFGITYYVERMTAISEAVTDSQAAISEVSTRFEESVETRQVVADYYNDQFLAKAKLIAYLLEEDPSVLNEPTDRQYTVYDEFGDRYFLYDVEGHILTSVANSPFLQQLCDEYGLGSVFVFDMNGRTIATNSADWYYAISTDPEDPSFEFRKVLDGKVDVMTQGLLEDERGGVGQYFASAFTYYTLTDENGATCYVSRYDYLDAQAEDYDGPVISRHHAMIQIGLRKDLVMKLQETTDLDYVFSANVLGRGGIVVFENSPEKTVLYAPMSSIWGKTAEELGLPAKMFSNEFYGFNTVNGVKFFTYCTFAEGYYVSTAIPSADVNRGAAVVALISALVSLLVTMLLMMTITLTTRKEEELYLAVAEEFKELVDRPFFRSFHMADPTAAAAMVARWNNRALPWRLRSPEQKLVMLAQVLVGIVVVTLLVFWLVDMNGGRESLMRYVLSGNWERGVNIFALTACVLVFVVVMVGVMLVSIPVRLIAEIMGPKAETVGHLLMSVLRYGSVLVVLFYGLYLLGVDASGLLASAGILSLVIGLGAQSLIKDIIAGIFIVFEGEFRVGDIITIGDFRGTVMDIGLRTTKVLGLSNNMKIINNSEISGVLNMTNQQSFTLVDVGVSYTVDLPYVEQVLAEELPKLEGKIPGMIGVPQYLGVNELTGSAVNLRFLANTLEADIFGVRRGLMRAIFLIFAEKGITIPYNMVTISNLTKDPESPEE